MTTLEVNYKFTIDPKDKGYYKLTLTYTTTNDLLTQQQHRNIQ